MARSVLDDLGEEITGILAPVSVCMALVVVLVKALNPDGGDGSTVAIATLAYQEEDGDSAGQRLGGALLNALIFMAVIAAMTFVLFLLFKWGCYRLIYGYMGFAMFNVFFLFTGALAVQLLRLCGVHLDLVSLCLLLVNFSVVGILSLFFMPVPLLLKQSYTVWVGICVAYTFTHIPEWTTWVLLGVMALYDLAAVLLPGGPLKILVDLAIERQQELPALVYESRPVGRPYQRGQWRRQGGAAGAPPEPGGGGGGADDDGAGGSPGSAPLVAGGGGGGGLGGERSASGPRVALLAGHARSSEDCLHEMAAGAGGGGGERQRRGAGGWASAPGPLGEAREPGSAVALLAPVADAADADGSANASSSSVHAAEAAFSSAAQQAGAAAGRLEVDAASSPAGRGGGPPPPPPSEGGGSSSGDSGLPDGIKLGLGDFIFYSMLVGRAAMYDMITVFSSYIAIIAGLGITLMLLALYRKALPALPVSIALGVLFYFLTRLVVEPFVVPLALNLAYY